MPKPGNDEEALVDDAVNKLADALADAEAIHPDIFDIEEAANALGYERGRKAERKKIIELIENAQGRLESRRKRHRDHMLTAEFHGRQPDELQMRTVDLQIGEADAYEAVLDMLKTRDEENDDG